MIPKRRYVLLVGLSVLVYIAGLFVTLFENDSAQFAVMAMRMVQENDFISLIKGSQDYLDKPHLHFWLAALSFKVFGIYDWAYRIPGILFTLLGAYSTYGLGKTLYDEEVGKLAALVFMTSQTIVLSAIDVRTDAVLTGSVILAIWQLAVYLRSGNLGNLLVGALACGLAFSTKGQIALLVIGVPLLCDVIHRKAWNRVFHPQLILGILVFAIVISPMLYAYYQQFDLHPEKVIRGVSERSGIRFIFWEQSFERLSGTGVGKNSSDYFFFFHTLLWVLLPWTFLTLFALAGRFRRLRSEWAAGTGPAEFLTFGGVVIVFLIISFAQFKLPHYLNVLIPLFAVITASYLMQLYKNGRTKSVRVNLGFQYFVLGVLFLGSLLLCLYVFKFENLTGYILFFAMLLPVGYYCLEKNDYSQRIIMITVLGSVMLNLVMNLHFYPRLLEYQGGSSMAAWAKKNELPADRIYKVSERHTWAMDFYLRQPLKRIDAAELRELQDIWVYVDDREKERLSDIGIRWDSSHSVDQFRITRLQARFLNPDTRRRVLNEMHLLHIP